MANQKDLLDNLAVLGCPCAVQDVNTLASQSAIIIWLEDRKIRSLDIEERHGLKTIDNKWAESVAQYFSNLDCPFQWVPQQSENIITDSNYECLLWLSQEAITFEFQDEMDSMEVITETNIDISDVVYQNLIHKLQITNDVGATNEGNYSSKNKCC